MAAAKKSVEKKANQSGGLFKKLEAVPAQTEHPHIIASKKPGRPPGRPPSVRLVNKLFRVKPEVARQFEMLKAEMQISGPKLADEAFNLLFESYGKPKVL